ncbi:hypothetical protein FOA52_003183 [Chlamydomonas sp. UWO 241]|nr:hypothetical protein FOA52_003183 [Chlamydomonas sp. UWO 241]
MIEDAASEVVRKTPRGERPAGEDQDDELLLPPWPLHVVVASCNVDISDAPPEGCAIEGMDTFSPNPFLPSFMKATEAVMGKAGGPAAAGKAGGKEEKKGADKKGKKGRNDSDGAPAKEYFLSSQSQSMDLTSPAGKYQLDLSHPASWLMLRHIINLGKQLAMAVEKGLLAKGVALKISDVVLDGRPSNAGRLDSLADVTKGIVSFGVACPSLLLATEPSALTEQTLDWLIVTLTDKACGELWKLSVLQVACSHFYFTWEQALQFIDLFDAEMAISERLRASEMMYSRCTNPLLFWEEALPTLPALQVWGECGD